MQPRTLTNRLFASVPETAELLGVDPRTLRRAIEDGQVPSVRVGVRVLIPTSWLRGPGRRTVRRCGHRLTLKGRSRHRTGPMLRSPAGALSIGFYGSSHHQGHHQAPGRARWLASAPLQEDGQSHPR